MTNAFGVVLDSASVRWAAAEGVPETVIAAVLLLDERSVDEIASKLRPGQLEQVIKIVGRSPSRYPPGTLETLKGRRQTPAPVPVASPPTKVATARPTVWMKPSTEHMRQAQERRLASLRVRAPQSAPEPEHAVTQQMIYFIATSLAPFGGDNGLTIAPRNSVAGLPLLKRHRAFYYVALICALATYLFCRALVASRFGSLLVLVVLFACGGLIGLSARLWRWFGHA
jgi:hypothetical protein